jgi:hypothetical protein
VMRQKRKAAPIHNSAESAHAANDAKPSEGRAA